MLIINIYFTFVLLLLLLLWLFLTSYILIISIQLSEFIYNNFYLSFNSFTDYYILIYG